VGQSATATAIWSTSWCINLSNTCIARSGETNFTPSDDHIASPRAPEMVASPPPDQADQLIAVAGNPAARRPPDKESRKVFLAVQYPWPHEPHRVTKGD